MSSEHSIYYKLALAHIKGLGVRSFLLLQKKYPNIEHLFHAPKKEILEIAGIQQSILLAISDKRSLNAAERTLHRCQALNISIIFISDAQYPQHLRHIHLPPLALYVKGETKYLHQIPRMAIIGTRKMTRYGQTHIQRICEYLAPYKTSIICGFGEGVEKTACIKSIDHQLNRIVVYPSGLEHPYPSTLAQTLIEKTLEKGCLISEYTPDTQFLAHGFMARNRMVVGLSQVLALIESPKKGGSMYTARLGMAENREVYALPGDIDRSQSEGCHQLIAENIAHILSHPEVLGKALGYSTMQQGKHHARQALKLSVKEQKIMEVLATHKQPLHIDEIAQETSIALDELSTTLLKLNLDDVIEFMAGNTYRVC